MTGGFWKTRVSVHQKKQIQKDILKKKQQLLPNFESFTLRCFSFVFLKWEASLSFSTSRAWFLTALKQPTGDPPWVWTLKGQSGTLERERSENNPTDGPRWDITVFFFPFWWGKKVTNQRGKKTLRLLFLSWFRCFFVFKTVSCQVYWNPKLSCFVWEQKKATWLLWLKLILDFWSLDLHAFKNIRSFRNPEPPWHLLVV